MPTKTELVKAKLAKNPNPSFAEIQEWAKEIGCSVSLVYKWMRRIQPETRMAVKPSEPIVKIEEEEEKLTHEAEEEEAIPEEFFEKPKEEVKPEEVEEVKEVEPEEQEQDILKEITKRSIKRFFAIAFEHGLGLAKGVGLSDEEAEDTQVLTMMLLAKYLQIQVTENMLEFTSLLHFSSLGLRVFVTWFKNRREEAKKQEVKVIEEPKDNMIEEVKIDEQKASQEVIKEAEEKYLKKLGLAG